MYRNLPICFAMDWFLSREKCKKFSLLPRSFRRKASQARQYQYISSSKPYTCIYWSVKCAHWNQCTLTLKEQSLVINMFAIRCFLYIRIPEDFPHEWLPKPHWSTPHALDLYYKERVSLWYYVKISSWEKGWVPFCRTSVKLFSIFV